MSETVLNDVAANDEALGRWLEANVEGFQRPFALNQFPAGQSNPTYRLRAASGDYVLRRQPFGNLPPSAHSVDREYRLLAGLHPFDFPVPRPLASCDDPAVIGAKFYVMELVFGRTYADGALPDFDAVTRGRMYEQLTDTLADLHSIDPQAIALGDFGMPNKYFERQVAHWTRQYRDCETDYLPEMERLIAFLPESLPAQTRSAIVHGDYRIDNILFDGGGTLTAVLDWELATLGDPLADFSYFAMQWMLPADGGAGLGGRNLELLGIPALKDIAARYSERSGVPVTDRLEWYCAYNLFRMAVIDQGMKRRGADDLENHRHSAELVRRVPKLAAAAWDFAKQAGA